MILAQQESKDFAMKYAHMQGLARLVHLAAVLGFQAKRHGKRV